MFFKVGKQYFFRKRTELFVAIVRFYSAGIVTKDRRIGSTPWPSYLCRANFSPKILFPPTLQQETPSYVPLNIGKVNIMYVYFFFGGGEVWHLFWHSKTCN
jgi:hypothetical protein